MKLYEIDRDYMDYLHKIDSKVLTHNVDKHQRKFIAIKVKLNGYQYFVPLSSPDFRDYYDDHGIKKVQFTRVPTIKRIFNGNPTVELFIDQVRVLRSKKNQEDILKRAQVVYKLKSRNSSYSYIQYATIDFSLLEKTCDKYIEKYGC